MPKICVALSLFAKALIRYADARNAHIELQTWQAQERERQTFEGVMRTATILIDRIWGRPI